MKPFKFFKMVVILFILSLSTGCGNQNVKNLTPRQLNISPQLYDGETVLVQGFVRLGTNSRSIWESEKRHEEYRALWEVQGTDRSEYKNDCLTIINANILFDNIDLVNEKTLTLRGTFIRDSLSDSMIDLQACSKTALRLDLEATRQMTERMRATLDST